LLDFVVVNSKNTTVKECGTTISTARDSGYYRVRLEINDIGEGTPLPKIITTTLEMPKKKVL